ncbi:MAG TPA: hypothetical protein V6C57_18160 [Coleofasciculaceae cyanobacterium]
MMWRGADSLLPHDLPSGSKLLHPDGRDTHSISLSDQAADAIVKTIGQLPIFLEQIYHLELVLSGTSVFRR